MPEWLQILILGIVEGITEFLPVSSTGHLLLTQQMFGNWIEPRSDLFNIVIQSGAVLAVIPLFRERLTRLIFQWRLHESRVFLGQVMLAFVITGFGGLLLEKNPGLREPPLEDQSSQPLSKKRDHSKHRPRLNHDVEQVRSWLDPVAKHLLS